MNLTGNDERKGIFENEDNRTDYLSGLPQVAVRAFAPVVYLVARI